MKYDEKEWLVLQEGNGEMLVTLVVMRDIGEHCFCRIIGPEFKWQMVKEPMFSWS